MELLILTNKDSEEVSLKDVTLQTIRETMDGIDWNEFTQVLLSKSDDDWISVGGNLKKDGLSCMYELDNDQHVIEVPPTTVDQMTAILVSYFEGDEKFKRENSFTSGSDDRRKREIEDKKKFALWKQHYQVTQKVEKTAKIKRLSIIFLAIALVSSIWYYWYTDELQFIGQNTEFAKAVVVNTQLHHLGNRYYIQIVTYEFEYDQHEYSGTFEVGRAWNSQKIGDYIKVKFSTSNPNRSKMVAFYRPKRMNSSEYFRLKSKGSEQ